MFGDGVNPRLRRMAANMAAYAERKAARDEHLAGYNAPIPDHIRNRPRQVRSMHNQTVR